MGAGCDKGGHKKGFCWDHLGLLCKSRHSHTHKGRVRGVTAGQRRLTPTHTLDIVRSLFFSVSCSRCFNSCFCPLSSLLVDACWVGSQTLPPQVTGSVCPSPPFLQPSPPSLPPLQLLSASPPRLTSSSNLVSNFFFLYLISSPFSYVGVKYSPSPWLCLCLLCKYVRVFARVYVYTPVCM